MAENFAGRAGVFFDTSVWSPLDLLDLYRLVPPEQVVYASDYPYGRQPNSLLLMAVRTARASGLDDAQVRAMLHDTAARTPTASTPLHPVRRVAQPSSPPVPFLRIHQYLRWPRRCSGSANVGDLRRPRARDQCRDGALERLPGRDGAAPRAPRHDA